MYKSPKKLLSSFTETDSLLENYREIDPVAALSSIASPYVQSTFKVLADCLNELNERHLAHRYVMIILHLSNYLIPGVRNLRFILLPQFFHLVLVRCVPTSSYT